MVKGGAVLGQLPQRLERQVPQLRQVGDPPKRPPPFGSRDPAFVGGRAGDEVGVGRVVQDDPARDARGLELAVQLAQGALGVVPAAALVDADEDVPGPQGPDQVHDRPVPLGPQDLLVVPVQAGDEDARGLVQDRPRPRLPLGAGDAVVDEVGLGDGPDEEQQGEAPEGGAREQAAEEDARAAGDRARLHGSVGPRSRGEAGLRCRPWLDGSPAAMAGGLWARLPESWAQLV